MSTQGLGKGLSEPSSNISNCMKTWFQISIQASESATDCSTKNLLACSSMNWGSRSGPRKRCISVQGPQGPTGPICQKLSLRPRRKMRSGRTPTSFQNCSASVSAGTLPSPSKTVIASRLGSMPSHSGLVIHSQPKRTASFLK